MRVMLRTCYLALYRILSAVATLG